MNSTAGHRGKLILIAAVALLSAPLVATIVSADLSTHSAATLLIARGASLGLVAVGAFATFRFRWAHRAVGIAAAILGSLGLLGCAAGSVLWSRSDVAAFHGRSAIGFICFTLATLFLAWALLLSKEVRQYERET